MKWKYEKFGALFKSKENRETWDRYFSDPPFPLHIWWRVLEIAQNYFVEGSYGNPKTTRTSLTLLNNIFCTYSELSPHISTIVFYKAEGRNKSKVYVCPSNKYPIPSFVFYEVEA